MIWGLAESQPNPKNLNRFKKYMNPILGENEMDRVEINSSAQKIRETDLKIFEKTNEDKGVN